MRKVIQKVLRVLKGVVRSKIGFFKNWICESRRPGRDIAFYPNKIGQKLAEIWGVQYNPLKTRFLSGFGWPDKSPIPVTSQNNQPIKFVE